MTTTPTEKPAAESPARHWYKDARHWYYMAAVLIALLTGVVLIESTLQGRRFNGLIESETSALKQTRVKKERLSDDKLAFQALLEGSLDQKEKVIRDIANFQEELNVLTRKTERLEQVRDDLKLLETAYAQYRRVEDEFSKSAALLTAIVRKGK